MPTIFQSIDLGRYKMDDWPRELVRCEDCLRIMGDDPRDSGKQYYEVYRPCDSGPWCPDNDLPDPYEDKT